MTPVRCPECGRLLGFFQGSGEVVCPRCRHNKVIFDTDKSILKFERLERR